MDLPICHDRGATAQATKLRALVGKMTIQVIVTKCGKHNVVIYPLVKTIVLYGIYIYANIKGVY